MSLANEPIETLLAALRRDRLAGRCIWQGQSAFVKRAVDLRWKMRLYTPLLKWLKRRFAPEQMVQKMQSDLEHPIPSEVCRIRQLAAQGIPVPEIWAVNCHGFVMEDVGPTVQTLIRDEKDDKKRQAWFDRALEETILLHQKNQWHGGSQLRNFVVAADGVIKRIDFELPLDRYLPLAILQSIDFYLLFADFSNHLPLASLVPMAQRYYAVVPDETRIVLGRIKPDLERLARFRLFAYLANKEHRRLAAVAQTIAALG